MPDPSSWRPPSPETVWGKRLSIYQHIRRHLQPDGAGLTPGGDTLPDKDPLAESIGFTGAVLDGVMTHHFGLKEKPGSVEQVLEALRAALDRPTETAALYGLLRQQRAVEIADRLLRKIRENRASLSRGRLRTLARWLATHAPHREPVKIGMAVLGLCGDRRDRKLLLTLGRHEELTLFAAVALVNSLKTPDKALWELARGVTAWGRIQSVRRLADTRDPRIRHWLLTEGYRNQVMKEYTAVLCAKTGGLRAALEKEPPDDDVFEAAGDLIGAMFVGGPAEDISDYEDGAAVVTRYLDLLQERARTLRHFLRAGSLRFFLSIEEKAWAVPALGWTLELRQRLIGRCDEILDRPYWRDQILEGLDSSDRITRRWAAAAAEELGMDVWERQLEWLAAGESDLWYHLLQTEDPARMDRLLDLAREKIDLKSIATGPTDNLGMGPAYTEHSNLGYVLQGLTRFPGKGWDLIRTGLRSPVVNNRSMVLRVLSACPRDQWQPGMERILRRALQEEPREGVRQWIQRVLAGEPLEGK